ncbi:MAG TPA: hypothetical protein VGI10_22700 [Polyangiaceae bacterium]|jgi:hypothetical protein
MSYIDHLAPGFESVGRRAIKNAQAYQLRSQMVRHRRARALAIAAQVEARVAARIVSGGDDDDDDDETPPPKKKTKPKKDKKKPMKVAKKKKAAKAHAEIDGKLLAYVRESAGVPLKRSHRSSVAGASEAASLNLIARTFGARNVVELNENLAKARAAAGRDGAA